MPQTRRKATKAATRHKSAASARSRRRLRDLDERDPSKVRGGASANPTMGSGLGGFKFGGGRTIIPCV